MFNTYTNALIFNIEIKTCFMVIICVGTKSQVTTLMLEFEVGEEEKEDQVVIPPPPKKKKTVKKNTKPTKDPPTKEDKQKKGKEEWQVGNCIADKKDLACYHYGHQ